MYIHFCKTNKYNDFICKYLLINSYLIKNTLDVYICYQIDCDSENITSPDSEMCTDTFILGKIHNGMYIHFCKTIKYNDFICKYLLINSYLIKNTLNVYICYQIDCDSENITSPDSEMCTDTFILGKIFLKQISSLVLFDKCFL